MEGGVRKDDTLQHKAVREALTNAVIHADFMLSGILKVEKFDDKLVFTNPGLLKLPIEQIYKGGESNARNQRMQAMLRMIGYGENIGSGFPLILSAWEERHWTKPELIEQPELMQVKLVLNTVGNYAEKSDVLKNVPNDVLKNVPKDILNRLTIRQKEILIKIAEEPTITWKKLSKAFDVSEKTIQRDFSFIKDAGIKLERKGSKTSGCWAFGE